MSLNLKGVDSAALDDLQHEEVGGRDQREESGGWFEKENTDRCRFFRESKPCDLSVPKSSISVEEYIPGAANNE